MVVACSGCLTEEPITISMLAVIFGQSGNHIALQASGKAGEMRLRDCVYYGQRSGMLTCLAASC